MSDQQHKVTLQQALDIAIQHHTAGRLSQAENIYQQVLENDPKQPVALNLMGVIAHQKGEDEVAVDLITRALTEMPVYAEAHNNLGLALHGLGRFEDAAANHQKAIDLKPDYPEAHYNLGNTFQGLGELNEAIASYHTALRLKPDYAKAHNNLGNALQDLGEHEQALVSFQAALALKPDLADALVNLGATYLQLGEPAKAIASYHRAIEIRPDHILGQIRLGLAQHSRRDFRLFQAKNLECLYALERYDDFYRSLDKVIQVDKENVRVAAISAFTSQQLKREDPYPFCQNPLRFVHTSPVRDIADNADDLVADLISHSSDNGDTSVSGKGDTGKTFQTQDDLFLNPTKTCRILNLVLRQEIKRYYTRHKSESCLFIASWPKTYRLKAWFTRMSKDQTRPCHSHPDRWLSGFMRLQSTDTEGRGQEKSTFTLHGYDYPILNSQYPQIASAPKMGDIALFPASLFYKSAPTSSEHESPYIWFEMLKSI